MDGLFKLVPAGQEGIDPGQLLAEVSEVSFTTTGTTVELRTQLSVVKFGAFTGSITIGSQDVQDDQISSDFVVSSGAITIERPASGLSGLTLKCMLIGTKT